MATCKIFVSFEFDRDNHFKKDFYAQASRYTRHKIKDCSLNEAYPTDKWRGKAKSAIRVCDVVIILVGKDTHNAPGVKVEVDIARILNKPVIQIRPQKCPYNGLPHLEAPIPWRWKRINRCLDLI